MRIINIIGLLALASAARANNKLPGLEAKLYNIPFDYEFRNDKDFYEGLSNKFSLSKQINEVKDINYDFSQKPHSWVIAEELSGFFVAPETGEFKFSLDASIKATLQFGAGKTCQTDAYDSVSEKVHKSSEKEALVVYLEEDTIYPIRVVQVVPKDSKDRESTFISLSFTQPSEKHVNDISPYVMQVEVESVEKKKKTGTKHKNWVKSCKATGDKVQGYKRRTFSNPGNSKKIELSKVSMGQYEDSGIVQSLELPAKIYGEVVNQRKFAIELIGYIKATETGNHKVEFALNGGASFQIGKEDYTSIEPMPILKLKTGNKKQSKSTEIDLVAGKSYPVRIVIVNKRPESQFQLKMFFDNVELNLSDLWFHKENPVLSKIDQLGIEGEVSDNGSSTSGFIEGFSDSENSGEVSSFSGDSGSLTSDESNDDLPLSSIVNLGLKSSNFDLPKKNLYPKLPDFHIPDNELPDLNREEVLPRLKSSTRKSRKPRSSSRVNPNKISQQHPENSTPAGDVKEYMATIVKTENLPGEPIIEEVDAKQSSINSKELLDGKQSSTANDKILSDSEEGLEGSTRKPVLEDTNTLRESKDDLYDAKNSISNSVDVLIGTTKNAPAHLEVDYPGEVSDDTTNKLTEKILNSLRDGRDPIIPHDYHIEVASGIEEKNVSNFAENSNIKFKLAGNTRVSHNKDDMERQATQMFEIEDNHSREFYAKLCWNASFRLAQGSPDTQANTSISSSSICGRYWKGLQAAEEITKSELCEFTACFKDLEGSENNRVSLSVMTSSVFCGPDCEESEELNFTTSTQTRTSTIRVEDCGDTGDFMSTTDSTPITMTFCDENYGVAENIQPTARTQTVTPKMCIDSCEVAGDLESFTTIHTRKTTICDEDCEVLQDRVTITQTPTLVPAVSGDKNKTSTVTLTSFRPKSASTENYTGISTSYVGKEDNESYMMNGANEVAYEAGAKKTFVSYLTFLGAFGVVFYL